MEILSQQGRPSQTSTTSQNAENNKLLGANHWRILLNTTHTPKAQGARQKSGKKNRKRQRPEHQLQDSTSYPGTYAAHAYELEDIIIAKLPQMTLSWALREQVNTSGKYSRPQGIEPLAGRIFEKQHGVKYMKTVVFNCRWKMTKFQRNGENEHLWMMRQ